MSSELNRRVAALMGWTPTDERDVWLDADEQAHVIGFVTGANFNPTGCENSAGLLVDRMATLGWMVTVYTDPYPGRGTVRRCCIMRHPSDAMSGEMIDEIADTRPLAISRAFVKAMERWGDG
jgi:hypothetical protein